MLPLEIRAVKFKNKLNTIFPGNQKHWKGSAIITAAGSGTRMGGVSKQLLPLHNKSCISYSLHAFDQCSHIFEIIVVAKSNEIELIQNICKKERISKPIKVVCGGETRQESVSNGFLNIDRTSDFVAIHDGARPLIQPNQIHQLIDAAKRYGAACAAEKITDTVKRADHNQLILSTVPREDLYAVQTPQVFKTDIYRVSLALSKKDNISVTDDTSLLEHAGFPVKLVLIGGKNYKLTIKEDVSTIEHLLEDQ